MTALQESNARSVEEEEHCRAFGDLAVQLTNNIVKVHFKMAEFEKAKDASIESLKLDPNNVSSMVIAANVCVERGEFDEASAVLDQAASSAASDGMRLEVQKAAARLKRRRAEYRKEEREMVARMTSKGFRRRKGGGEGEEEGRERRGKRNGALKEGGEVVEAQGLGAMQGRDAGVKRGRITTENITRVVGAVIVIAVAILTIAALRNSWVKG